MSILHHLVERTWFKVAVFGLFFGSTALFTFGTFYVRFHYLDVMPRSPQAEAGRIYPVKAQFGVTVYVNKKEREIRSFVEEDMLVAAIASWLLLFFLGKRLGWFKKKPPWDSSDPEVGGDGA